ncbi:UDP-N-acetylglucosamine 1-carboxyvinyltransferase [Wolbachia pipientis]|uniref:UDP-N-acetylglucosamine 1-carboxyvinyltransferase n=1 Tax=Wolbachia pipientis TaxID=955 RepID=A0A1E7QL53_WOLPI|nr:UDP-N-acetylglucosamine 1-carboxyvinyltransferase [Wolbachia pipientis]OEY86944.1 UDP-N-acetylglucosamine 1-carboxyvinyltransferase [Wolbachia pipientis]
MHKIIIKNNYKPLVGNVRINGAKNAILPIIAASILCSSPVILFNVPDITDVHSMSMLLTSLGAEVNFIRNRNYKANHTLEIDCSKINNHIISSETASKVRTSILLLGPMLSRFGKINTSFPGGCNIGTRLIDMHIKALEEMGAKIVVDENNITATVEGKLQGKGISFERVSVGATQNIIMAAILAEGVTVIYNPAIEPEICNLIEFLIKMGANITIQENKIIITGVEKLNGCSHKIIPDRIEAGTYSLAAIITDGELTLEEVSLPDMKCVVDQLKAIGAKIKPSKNSIIISRENCHVEPVNVSTNPYPCFPSDMQPQLTSVLCIANGVSTIEENLYNNRFTHVHELKKAGANISIEENRAIITGTKKLCSSNLYANDLRSAAALVLASLVAEGATVINNCSHLYRGYEVMHEKLNMCGANISLLT